MSNVSILTDKLDNLANSIALKSGASIPLTLDQMKAAVDSISTGGGGGGTITIEEIPNATGTTLQITTNGSSSPTTEIIIPEQTVTVSQAYTQLTYNKSFVTGDEYIWTINGTTGTATAISQSGSIGFVTSLSNDVALEWTGTDMYLDVMDSSLYGSYTVKVEKIVASGGGSTPSATQHTIHLEFSDETDADIDVYYDNALIGTMITNYTPNPWTYNNKLVYYASLDNVLWYDGSGSWETVYDGLTNMTEDTESDLTFAWVSALGDVSITENSVWRVTWRGTERIHTAVYDTFGDRQRYGLDSRNDGTNGAYYMYDTGYGAWMFVSTDSNDVGNISIKVEQKTS